MIGILFAETVVRLNRLPMLNIHFFLLQRAASIIFLFLRLIFSISFEKKEEKALHCRSFCPFPDLGIMPDDWVAFQAALAAKSLTAFVSEE